MKLINNFLKKIKYETNKIKSCKNCRYCYTDSIWNEPTCSIKSKKVRHLSDCITCENYKTRG